MVTGSERSNQKKANPQNREVNLTKQSPQAWPAKTRISQYHLPAKENLFWVPKKGTKNKLTKREQQNYRKDQKLCFRALRVEDMHITENKHHK